MGSRARPGAERQWLAYEAARIMAEDGVSEFERARRKAAQRAGIGDRRRWPSNEEIQQALIAQRRLFDGERQARDLRTLRQQALIAMRRFADFRPRLVGPALYGSGDMAQGVRLLVFADSPEEVILALMDQGIPWREQEEWLRFGGGVRHTCPVLSFLAGETPFALVVLPRSALRNPPLDPVTDRPERGADADEVARLASAPDPLGAL
jgi:hypothetical protein